jgi:starvation-inducible DNA-binding protein
MVLTKIREVRTMDTALKDTINRQIAGWTVLYEKLHHYHWFVKGTGFFTLHAKFEELYNEAASVVDELAERLLAVGETPISTLKQCLEMSPLKEAAGGETAVQMVKQLIDDFATLRDGLKQGITLANESGDDVTADMFTAKAGELDKHIWMLQAYLS